MNGGVALYGNPGERERRVRFAWPGCSDILGQLRGGTILAVEIKRPGGKPTPAQAGFLKLVNETGGVGFVACSIDAVFLMLG